MWHIIYIAVILALAGLALYYKKDSEAREKGIDEIEEGYQAEILDAEDRLQNAWEHVEILRQKNNSLSEKLVQKEAVLRDVSSENVGLRNQLDIAQKIISEHDLNCLPHVVFKETELEFED